MDLMKDSHFNKKYHKHKIRIKKWESSFIEQYQRKPNKNDIKTADSTIREAYKIYWGLKTKMLEEIFKDEDIHSNPEESTLVKSNDLDPTLNDTSKEPFASVVNSVNSENTDANINTLETVSCSSSLKTKNNKKTVWGHHLNMTQDCKKSKNDSVSSSSFQLSQKMFKSLSFSKRNPKKLVSQRKSENDDTENSDKCSKEVNVCTKSNTESKTLDAFNISECTRTNLKIISLKNKLSSASSNTFQQLIQGPSKINSRSLNEKWLNKCLETDMDMETEADSFLNTSENSDDFVFNSDCEDDCNKKRKRNSNEIFDDEEFKTAKKLCVENNLSDAHDMKRMDKHSYDLNKDNEFLKDFNDSINAAESSETNENLPSTSTVKASNLNENQFDSMTSATRNKTHDVDALNTELSNTDPQIFENESKSRNKPVRRRTNQDLNKNFRRINIKKKVFARGKKPFNASSYKRAQWKKRNKR